MNSRNKEKKSKTTNVYFESRFAKKFGCFTGELNGVCEENKFRLCSRLCKTAESPLTPCFSAILLPHPQLPARAVTFHS